MQSPKEKSPVPVTAGCEAQEQIILPFDVNTPLTNFRYPEACTFPATAFAIMLKGRYVSTPSMTYSHLKATRLPAYIETLEGMGLRGFINKSNLPLTKYQRSRGRGKPFAQYCLSPCVIVQEGERGQLWAAKVIAHNNLRIDDFQFSKLWLAHLRCEV